MTPAPKNQTSFGAFATIADTPPSVVCSDHALPVQRWTRPCEPLAHTSFARLLANRWHRTRASASQLLSEPAPFVTLDYERPAPPLAHRWNAFASRDGTAHGLLLWFDAELTPAIAFSNSPAAPPALYGQAYFPFSPAIDLRRDERLEIELRAVLSGDDYAWIWTATDEMGRCVRHSTLHGIPMNAEALARRAEEFVPRRSADAEVLLALIGATDGSMSFGALAGVLHERFAERFPTRESALRYLTRLDDLWEQA